MQRANDCCQQGFVKTYMVRDLVGGLGGKVLDYASGDDGDSDGDGEGKGKGDCFGDGEGSGEGEGNGLGDGEGFGGGGLGRTRPHVTKVKDAVKGTIASISPTHEVGNLPLVVLVRTT
jgi:hypothetical protein